MNTTFTQTNFTGGLLAPRLFGRTDLDKYGNSVALSENWIHKYHGGIVRRRGTQHAAEVSVGNGKFIPFQFDEENAYAILIQDQVAKFFRNGVYVSGADVSLPYADSEVPDIDYTQSLNVIFLVHPSHPPAKLSRTGVDTFAYEVLDFIDGPYDNIQYIDGVFQDHKLTVSGVTGTISVTAPAAIFSASLVGRPFRWGNDEGKWGWGTIVAFIDTSHIQVTLEVDLTENAEGAKFLSPDWRVGSWSAQSGYPRTVTLYQQRLWFAGTESRPDSIWATESTTLNAFAPTDPDGTVTDSSALFYTIDSGFLNVILWMQSNSKGLVIGTASAEYLMRSGASSDAVTPTNVGIYLQGTRGSRSGVGALQVGVSTVFVQYSGKKLYEFAYSFETDQYRSSDLTLLSEQMGDSGFVSLAYHKEPDSQIISVRSDGVLGVLTYERDQNVTAWSEWTLGGSGLAKDVTSIEESGASRLYILVSRTIGGVEKYYVESMSSDITSSSGLETADYLDSYVSREEAYDFTDVTGLEHLEGETVCVFADGYYRGDITVSGGAATLAAAARRVVIGYCYSSRILTLPLENRSAGVDPHSRVKAVHRVSFYQYNSARFKYGASLASDDLMPSDRSSGAALTSAPSLDSGRVFFSIDEPYDIDTDLAIVQDEPYPTAILSITYEVDMNDHA